jgi:hypothetical protein
VGFKSNVSLMNLNPIRFHITGSIHESVVGFDSFAAFELLQPLAVLLYYIIAYNRNTIPVAQEGGWRQVPVNLCFSFRCISRRTSTTVQLPRSYFAATLQWQLHCSCSVAGVLLWCSCTAAA